MSDERDDDPMMIQAAAAVTAEEIAAFEKGVRDLIRHRSAFDKHFEVLDEMLTEKEQTDEKPSVG